MKLYELSEEDRNIWTAIEAALEDPDADWDAAEAALKQCEQDFDGKIENCAKLTNNLLAQCDALDAEIERLTNRRKAFANKAASLKNYMKGEMEYVGRLKIKTALFSVAVQNSPVSLNVWNESQIPETYFKVIPATRKLDNEAVKKALKEGRIVPGAELFQGTHLRIR